MEIAREFLSSLLSSILPLFLILFSDKDWAKKGVALIRMGKLEEFDSYMESIIIKNKIEWLSMGESNLMIAEVGHRKAMLRPDKTITLWTGNAGPRTLEFGTVEIARKAAEVFLNGYE